MAAFQHLKSSPWDNNLVQFARLLREIMATQDSLDVDALCESMDLEPDDVFEIFERAHVVWEEAKEEIREEYILIDPLKKGDQP